MGVMVWCPYTCVHGLYRFPLALTDLKLDRQVTTVCVLFAYTYQMMFFKLQV